MASGLAAAGLANPWLAMLGATAFTAPATTYVQLHTGEPGPSGTLLVSSVTTRPAITWGTASAGSVAAVSAFPSWANWAGTNNEVVTNISVWTAASSGTFLFSVLLTGSKTVGVGDSLTLSSLSLALSPIAA
jgi:hypothetical protein